MDSVLSAIDQRRAELTAELAKLDAARAGLSPSPTSNAVQGFGINPTPTVAVPSPKKPAAPTEPAAPIGSDKPNGRSQHNTEGLTLEQCRDRVRAVLTQNSPLSAKQIQQMCEMTPWQVAKAMASWSEVEHTTESVKSPYRLRPPTAGPAA